jgi:YegS/Rv2252/BmrU family lipid kinase
MWIPVIVNPAAGHKAPILTELNNVFYPAGIRWTVEITLGEGDAYRQAQELADQGAEIVAVYGGDGTVSEAASALAGTDSALAILPGGTGNVFAYEFQIPRDYIQAARMLTGKYRVKVVDLGQTCNRKFLLRAGVGFESLVIEKTQHELKDRIGLLAYGLGGLQALREIQQTRYQLELDGQPVEATGLLCTVANAGHLGIPGLRLFPAVSMDDGMLDVIVLQKININILISHLMKNVTDYRDIGELQHWQVNTARIMVDPPQTVQVDGDIVGSTPVEVVCIPRCLRLIVPIM